MILQERKSWQAVSRILRHHIQQHHHSSAYSFHYNSDTGIVQAVLDDDSLKNSNNKTKVKAFQAIIGLEVHAQLDIPTKLFSLSQYRSHDTKTRKIGTPNSEFQLSPYDLAYPGTLPVISYHAVEAAILSAYALGCKVNQVSRFERKHYTYADMPNGYQVTQQRWPIASHGKLECRLDPSYNPNKRKNLLKSNNEGRNFVVAIDRIQLEQDSGKTTNPNDESNLSLVDLNRAGCALIEIVFAPDIRTAAEAGEAFSSLQKILKFIGTCDGKMEDGSLRCDLNISIAPISTITEKIDEFISFSSYNVGNRVEIKNLNSIRQVIDSAEYEILRQAKEYISGKPTMQETRTFDVVSQKTLCIRKKEGAVDYRFMPEPDLPPLVLNKKSLNGLTLDEIRRKLPELPKEVEIRILEQYGIDRYYATIIASDKNVTNCFEEAVRVALDELSKFEDGFATKVDISRTISNWLCNDVFGLIKNDQGEIPSLSVDDGRRLGTLVAMIFENLVSSTMAKKVLSIMLLEEKSSNPRDIANSRGLKMITDKEQLFQVAKELIFDDKYQSQRSQYVKGGKHVIKMEKFFVGKLMAKTNGMANPDMLNKVVQDILQSSLEL